MRIAWNVCVCDLDIEIERIYYSVMRIPTLDLDYLVEWKQWIG
jgi:hypothetical protein